MDVVVRTPHGDADVELVAVPTSSTLGDLIDTVTGQAPPPTARVDDRLVATSTPLAAVGLMIGSLIDTRLDVTQHAVEDADAIVRLVQTAGRGTGTITSFAPGRYRIGSARRLHAPELERAPVEAGAFDLIVSATGPPRISPLGRPAMTEGPYMRTHGHERFDTESDWTGGTMTVGGRVFQIEWPIRPSPRRNLPDPSPDGTVPFHRATVPVVHERQLTLDARHDATSTSGALWQRRPSDANAFHIPFGIHRNGVSTTTIDLQRHAGVALVGSDRFTAGLARAVLIELTTLHGPADVDIAIATTPERLGGWSWARWLPHVRRGGPDAPPQLFADPAALDALAHALQRSDSAAPLPPPVVSDAQSWQPPTTASAQPRLTLLVIDDIALWSSRDAPLRSLVTNPPPHLRVVVLTGAMNECPGMCTSLIEEITPTAGLERIRVSPDSIENPALLGSLADLHVRQGSTAQVISDIRPALVEPEVASDIARSLAPLDDIESTRAPAPPTRLGGPSLAELVSTVDATDRHMGSARQLRVSIGMAANPTPTAPSTRSAVTVDLAHPEPTWVLTSQLEQHDLTVAAVALTGAAQRDVSQLAMLIISREQHDWHAELPHIAGWSSHAAAAEPSRLIHRVAHVLTEQPDLDVVIIIEHALDATSSANPASPLVVGMTELAASLPNVHLVLTATDASQATALEFARTGASTIWIGADGNGTATEMGTTTSLVGAAAGSPASASGTGVVDPLTSELRVRPASHGRPMTPLERRLARASDDAPAATEVDGFATAAVARHVVNARAGGPDRSARVALLPPPLPSDIRQSLLLERHAGDGVPLGLIDRPERAASDVYWWQPGSTGSLLAVGSPRSGMTAILDLVIVGVAARMSADDVHLYAIEALPQRRRALAALPHTGSVVAPDDVDAVIAMIAALHAEVADRIEARRHDDRADLVLLVGDVSRLSRALAGPAGSAALQQLGDIAATGAAVGVDLIAVVGRTADLGGVARLTGDRLVGAVADSDDRIQLGAPGTSPADRQPGRCWSTTADRRVQLADPADSVELEIAVLEPEPARHRPPVDLVSGVPR